MKKLIVSNADLIEEVDTANLSAIATAGDNTLTVYSISGFAINKPLLVGEFGQDGTEIIKTHTSTAPSGSTITLLSALVKSHTKDTKVYVLPYDQVQFYHATTTTGDKTLISTSDVNEESNETQYTDTTYTSGYFFSRFYNSIDAGYSDYSDPIPYGGFDSNTVGSIIEMAMSETKKEFTETLTYKSLVDEINSCLRYVRGKLKRWSNVQEFDYVVDQIDRGEYSFTLPTTYYDKNSNRSCLNVRVGDSNLTYKDKNEFNEILDDVHKTTVATEGAVGATSLVLTSAADFDDSGTIHVYSGSTQYAITYTAKSTNTLTGVPASGTGSITATLTAGLNVWQNESEGTPKYFTIADGYLYILPLIDSTDSGMNIVMDFYTDIVEINSDADTITLARHDMVKHWLKWQIRNITENNGQPNLQDGDWMLFNSILSDAVRREASGQKFKMKPFINGIQYRGENRVGTFETI